MNVNKCFFLSVANIWRIFWFSKFLGTEKSTITPFAWDFVYIQGEYEESPCLLGCRRRPLCCCACSMLFVICMYILSCSESVMYAVVFVLAMQR